MASTNQILKDIAVSKTGLLVDGNWSTNAILHSIVSYEVHKVLPDAPMSTHDLLEVLATGGATHVDT